MLMVRDHTENHCANLALELKQVLNKTWVFKKTLM